MVLFLCGLQGGSWPSPALAGTALSELHVQTHPGTTLPRRANRRGLAGRNALGAPRAASRLCHGLTWVSHAAGPSRRELGKPWGEINKGAPNASELRVNESQVMEGAEKVGTWGSSQLESFLNPPCSRVPCHQERTKPFTFLNWSSPRSG